MTPPLSSNPPKLARVLLAGAGLLGLGVIAIVAVRMEHRRQHLHLELSQLTRQAEARAALRQTRDQLNVQLAQFGDLDALRQRAQQAEGLHSEAAATTLRVRNLELKEDPAHLAAPVWPDGSQVWEAKDWKDVGNRSPEAALETLLWAARSGETDKVAGVIELQGRALAGAKMIYDLLPPEEQARYGNPKTLVANVLTSLMPTDYQAAAVFDADGNASQGFARVRVEAADSQQSDLAFLLSHGDDGWHVNVPAKEVGLIATRLNITLPKTSL